MSGVLYFVEKDKKHGTPTVSSLRGITRGSQVWCGSPLDCIYLGPWRLKYPPRQFYQQPCILTCMVNIWFLPSYLQIFTVSQTHTRLSLAKGWILGT